MAAPLGPRALLQDGGWALRTLRRNPGFALFTAAVIGLGVGAATAVFSVLEPLMLAPLPFDEPDRLVWIAHAPSSDDASLSAVTSRTGNLRDFRERTRSFDGLTGYNAFFDQGAYTLTGEGEPERLVGAGVAHDFLEVLGVEPLLGRSFTAEEGLRLDRDSEAGPAAVILTHGFWQRRFAADPTLVGRSLVMNDVSRTVVGVLPPGFDFSSVFTPGVEVDFLLPFPISDDTDRWGNMLVILGRLRAGVTPEAAQADLDAVVAGLQEAQPDRWGLSARLTPLQERIAGPFRPALLLLAAAAGTLLLIVCVNVSNLLLARSPGRAREMAVRRALGASRGRLVRQLVLETLAIAAAGALAGGALAWAVSGLVAGTAGIRIPLLSGVRVDGGALLFAAAVAILTGLAVSLVPALQVREGGEASALRESGRGGSASRKARRLREVLVVAEVTLACVLLVVGGLFVRSFRAVLDVDLGFEPAGVVAWQLNPSTPFQSRREMTDHYAALTARVLQVPGVEDAGLVDALPLGRNRSWGFGVVGDRDGSADDPGYNFFPHLIDPGYLSTLRIPVVAGRGFTADDREGSQQVVLMNEAGARRVFGEADPVGRRIVQWNGEWEIVGVVRDVRHVSPETGPGIQVYFPFAQMWDFSTLDLAVRSRLGEEETRTAVAAALREIDPSMPVRESWTLDSTVERAVSARRFTLGILTAYGLAALFLAGLGVYGVLAQSVAERRPEIGIRMALGASAPDVLWSVMRSTMALAGLGILAGGLLSFLAAGVLGSQLYGVSARDPLTFVAMALVLLTVAALAGAVPAARAARTPGVGALRAD
jgi:predicted permease